MFARAHLARASPPPVVLVLSASRLEFSGHPLAASVVRDATHAQERTRATRGPPHICRHHTSIRRHEEPVGRIRITHHQATAPNEPERLLGHLIRRDIQERLPGGGAIERDELPPAVGPA